MLLSIFRKYVVGSKVGLTLFYAVTSCIAMSLGFGFNLRSLLIFGLFGLIGGNIMATKTYKQGSYFMKNLQDDSKYTQMQSFRKMLAKEEVPKSKSEQVEYGNYLLALEESKTRLSANYQWWSMVFLFGMFILFLVSAGFNLLSLIFPIVLIAGAYQIIKSKKDLQKIDRLKRQLSGLRQHVRQAEPAKRKDN